MKVVELRKGEGKENQKDDPGLPAIKLIVTVHDSSDEQLDGGLGDE